jgi:hypothetical protein
VNSYISFLPMAAPFWVGILHNHIKSSELQGDDFMALGYSDAAYIIFHSRCSTSPCKIY